MVGAYDLQAALDHGLAQRLAVGSRLHCRVALDAVAQSCIVVVAEEQVGHSGLACHVVAVDERQLAGGGHVQHVQPPAALACQLGYAPCALVAGFGTAYFLVKTQW